MSFYLASHQKTKKKPKNNYRSFYIFWWWWMQNTANHREHTYSKTCSSKAFLTPLIQWWLWHLSHLFFPYTKEKKKVHKTLLNRGQDLRSMIFYTILTVICNNKGLILSDLGENLLNTEHHTRHWRFLHSQYIHWSR